MTVVDAPDLGGLVGLAGDRVVTYLACPGLPCPIVATDLPTAGRRLLAVSAGPATVVAAPGARVVHVVGTASGQRLAAVDVDGGPATDLGPLPDDLQLHPGPVLAASAMRLPPGWILLTRDGRLPIDGPSDRPLLRRVQDGISVRLDEVTR